MYNRYIRNDNGSYTRIPQEETAGASAQGAEQPPRHSPPPETERKERETDHRRASPPPPPPKGGGPGRSPDGLSGFLRHMLDQLHLDHVDTGDLLLLILLFFLFREDADEELLVSLGLLLIL